MPAITIRKRSIHISIELICRYKKEINVAIIMLPIPRANMGMFLVLAVIPYCIFLASNAEPNLYKIHHLLKTQHHRSHKISIQCKPSTLINHLNCIQIINVASFALNEEL